MASSTTRLMSFAEFERLPDSPLGARYELRHGEVFQVPPPTSTPRGPAPAATPAGRRRLNVRRS